MADKKPRLLYLAKYFQDYTDEQHPKSLSEISDYLARHEVPVERKTFYQDIECLVDFGMDIQHTSNRTRRYYLGDREFELSELKLLIDVVQASPFLTTKKSMELIEKLSHQTSEPSAHQLKRQVYVMNRVHMNNEQLYYSIDGINNAINENRKVSFRYFNWTVDGTKEYRKKGEKYIVNPVALCVDRFYYLVAFDTSTQSYRHYRVDRMDHLSTTDIPRDTLPDSFDLGSYVKNIVSMYTGETQSVRLRARNALLNSLVDRFGSDCFMHAVDNDHFELTAPVEVSPTFFGWVSQFGDGVEILSPQSVRSDYIRFLKESLSLYPDGI